FGVLVYYAVANASAWTLDPGPWARVVPAVGFAGCAVLAFSLPGGSVVVGAGVLVVGALVYGARRGTASLREGPRGVPRSVTTTGCGCVMRPCCRGTRRVAEPGPLVRIVPGSRADGTAPHCR